MSERTGLALSIQQPWAWLIVNGFKDVENRDWPTKIRGIVGVHAGKKIDHGGIAIVRSEFPQAAASTRSSRSLFHVSPYRAWN